MCRKRPSLFTHEPAHAAHISVILGRGRLKSRAPTLTATLTISAKRMNRANVNAIKSSTPRSKSREEKLRKKLAAELGHVAGIPEPFPVPLAFKHIGRCRKECERRAERMLLKGSDLFHKTEASIATHVPGLHQSCAEKYSSTFDACKPEA